jgi:hypothetical protein
LTEHLAGKQRADCWLSRQIAGLDHLHCTPF